VAGKNSRSGGRHSGVVLPRLNRDKDYCVKTRETIVIPPIGMSLHWRGDLISRIDLSWEKHRGRLSGGSTICLRLAETLGRYVQGERIQWPDLPLDINELSPFARVVLLALRAQVGWGELITYGRLAALCGNPRAARAVGAVMRANPWPLVVPCHRVIGSTGMLTGFGSGLPMKEYLLGLESSWPLTSPA
jgi:methylated-DNA-[protein]-cysteine S-methyltransferase